MRTGISIALNLFVPGSGLVLVKRERWGMALACVFCASGHVALFGSWITPASISSSVTLVGWAGVAASWVAAQALMWSRVSVLRSPDFDSQQAVLRQMGAEAIEDGIYVNARLALQSALALDDEDLDTNVLWARLMTLVGRFPEARRTWRRVQQLDGEGRYRQESAEALRQLPSD